MAKDCLFFKETGSVASDEQTGHPDVHWSGTGAGRGKLELDPGWLSSSRNLADMIKEIRKGNTEGYVLFDYSSLYRDVTQKEVKIIWRRSHLSA